ncbi:hypothetical protein IMSHALPRED_008265 [Imshaugia aleurites]|uniref:Uncharacterized protein n=1 Tax=Imshaugia aleurites TaxID=172621 RepID=A0A8H3FX87_9LECA|nr:hypothetical protein IMSHALPRED_008265 [Imshaugia aleurites]
MFTTSLAWLAVLAPTLSRASPIATPGDLATLEKRIGNVGSFASYFPDCSEDPSYAVGASQYEDGSGVYVTSSCDNGLTTPAVVRFHCWTDLFVVNYQAGYSNWQNSGQVIDCATTSSCSEFIINMNSSCTTDTTTWDNNFGTKIEAQIPLWFNKDASGTAGLSYDHSFGGANAVQMCTSQSDTGTCNWNDRDCHAVWSAQRNIQVNGYLRRSCNTPRSGTNVPNSSQRSDGYYTVGMQDYNFQVPDNRIVGCGAYCGDLTYPDPTPGSDPLTPIPSGT